MARMQDAGILRLKQFTWPQRAKLDLYHFGLTLRQGKQKAVGSAVDSSKDKALLRAFMEAVERSFLIEHGGADFKNTNGLALHFDRNKAAENARCELLERDRFFCHYLARHPFYEIPRASIDETSTQILQYLSRSGCLIHIREMQATTIHKSALIAVEWRSRGIALSTACAKNLDDAIAKALLEAVGMASFGMEQAKGVPANKTPKNKIPHESGIPALNDWGPKEHGLQLHNKRYWAEFKKIYLEHPLPAASNVPERSPRIACKISRYTPKFAKGFKAVAARATSASLQLLYFGATRPDEVNLARVNTFAGSRMKFDDLHQRPHPFA